MNFRLLLIAAAALGIATSASAATIDFEIPTTSDDPVTVDGFDFDYIDRNGWVIGSASDTTIQFDNGSQVILCRDTVDSECGIVMSVSGGGTFDLNSFDGADGFLGVGGRTISVLGNLFGGGTIFDSFETVASAYTSFFLTGFDDLISVVFSVSGPGDTFMVLDNIVVNEGGGMSPVPVPASLPLLGLGIATLLGLRKRRQL